MRLLLFLAVPLAAQTPCADMARLPDVTAAAQTATHCRVSITLKPSAGSEIKSEVWLPPAAAWELTPSPAGNEWAMRLAFSPTPYTDYLPATRYV